MTNDAQSIVKPVPATQDDLLNFVSTLAGSRVKSPTCRLCNSELCTEAETLYERVPNIQSVANFLKDKGVDISYATVRKHLQNHYNTHQSELALKELAQRLDRWETLDTSDEALLRRYVKLLNMEAMFLLAENPSLPAIERRKNNELFLKISTEIKACQQQLKEIGKQLQPVEIVFKTLHRIIEIKISDTNSPEVKRTLMEVMENLSREIGDMPIEGFSVEE